MKVAVIGCTHAGTAAILNTAALYPEAEITVYERNDNISFLSCGIALYVGGVVNDPAGLFYSSPDALKEKGVKTYMQHDVTDVNFEDKSLTVQNILTGEVFADIYDKLIITTGSWPILPPIEGATLKNVLICKNYDHSKAIIESSKTAKNVVVVGGGYIGVELAEAFKENGKHVTLIDTVDRLLNKYLDEPFSNDIEASMRHHGVEFALGQTVQKFEGTDGHVTKVVTDQNSYDADLVILCVGFKPSTTLFKGKLDMLGNGAIVVDKYMQTSQADVFAAGDCCSVYYNPTGQQIYIPLATNAIRMGTLTAKNLMGPKVAHRGTQGTSGIKIYDSHAAATGLTEEGAKLEGFKVEAVTIEDAYRPEFMPTAEKVRLKIVYEVDTQKILGAQLISKIDMTQMINTLSVAIQAGMTMEDLALIDFFFLPHFNKPWSLINAAGLKAIG